MGKCIVCGRRLITGRKYCHVHRGESKDYYRRRERIKIDKDTVRFILIVGFFFAVVYFAIKIFEGLSQSIRAFFSKPLYAFPTLILLGLFFYLYYSLWKWLKIHNLKTYNMFNHLWVKTAYIILLLVIIMGCAPTTIFKTIVVALFMLLLFSFIIFLIYLFIKKKFYD